MKNAEQHLVVRDTGNEAENSNCQENNAKKYAKCFNHSDLLLVERGEGL
jgi:hypothetical protein